MNFSHERHLVSHRLRNFGNRLFNPDKIEGSGYPGLETHLFTAAPLLCILSSKLISLHSQDGRLGSQELYRAPEQPQGFCRAAGCTSASQDAEIAPVSAVTKGSCAAYIAYFTARFIAVPRLPQRNYVRGRD
jgi:hypothetical protein